MRSNQASKRLEETLWMNGSNHEEEVRGHQPTTNDKTNQADPLCRVVGREWTRRRRWEPAETL